MPLLDHLPQIDTLHIFTVKANESGYVEYINFNRLVELSKEFKGTIVLHLRIGEFISANQPLVDLYTNRKVKDESQLQAAINRTLTYEEKPSSMYDPNFARAKLIEVALRQFRQA